MRISLVWPMPFPPELIDNFVQHELDHGTCLVCGRILPNQLTGTF